MSNPLLEHWDTPHNIPPFEVIEPGHFPPAFERAFAEQNAEIQAIIANPTPPDFENTIEALEASGQMLERVSVTCNLLIAAHSNDELLTIQKRFSPELSRHFARIFTNPALFERVDAVYQASLSSLAGEPRQLLLETWNRFIRAGASLDEAARAEVVALDEELASLQTAFGQNILKDANAFELTLESTEELAGLPASVRESAASEAERRGKPGKYVFTISRSSITPFLQYSTRRDLREVIWRAYTGCADNGNDFDNNETVAKVATLRLKRARLLGYDSHAAYVLDDRMAGTPEAVTGLLDQVWAPARQKAIEERRDMQDRIQAEGGNFKLAPWDWWYYTEKVRAERFSLDPEAVKAYFPMERVRQGAFDVAGKLYGISFQPSNNLPKYHEDVEAFEVIDNDGSLIGIFYTDYFMRPSKRSGAWMNSIRKHSTHGGHDYPVVFNTCNFPKGDPALLGMDEVRTLFHEFGHGLHGLLSKAKYRSLSGTSVKRDFVELPSQIMEHWAVEPEVLKTYARHYKTGEPIPDELIEKLLATQTFNQGFATTEYLAASYLDMKWHGNKMISDGSTVAEFESKTLQGIQLMDEIAPRYRSTYFQHIFSGGYSAGYYSYIWAEVLDADAYEAFREKGIFDQETAKSFRENILERGGTADPMSLYQAFRGREPDVNPLLKGRGLT
ncbi:MAG: M3 family metallopeptidase [Pseudomonadales bacterium]